MTVEHTPGLSMFTSISVPHGGESVRERAFWAVIDVMKRGRLAITEVDDEAGISLVLLSPGVRPPALPRRVGVEVAQIAPDQPWGCGGAPYNPYAGEQSHHYTALERWDEAMADDG